jgi:hypothetical protein
VTKLPDDAELALRRLDDEDDDPETDCTERQPYRRLWAELLTASQDLAGIKFLAKAGLGPERLAPAKRMRGQRRHKPDPLAFAVDDVSRLAGTMPAATAELVAVERCRRSTPHDGLWGQWCTVDKYDDLDEGWDEELDELVEKLRKRLHR